MSKTPTPRDVEALIELFDQSDWKELDLRTEGFELFLAKDPAARRMQAVGETQAPIPLPSRVTTSTAQVAGSATPREAVAVPSTWVAVRAPNLGTFYRAPKPGASPYVEIGQQVGADTEVCLIEVMKLFTSVRAGVAGVVRQLAVQDAEMVEHEQVLMYIEPRA